MRFRPVVLFAAVLLSAAAQAAPKLPVLGSGTRNLATGKPVRTNAPGDPSFDISKVNDGDPSSCWWGEHPNPVWVTIDLQQEHVVNKVNIAFYSDGYRYYRYYVEVSTDGERWQRVVDDTRRTRPTPEGGEPRVFDPVPARYVRLTVPESYRSFDTAHAYEIGVYEAQGETCLVPMEAACDVALPLPLEQGPRDLASLAAGSLRVEEVPYLVLTRGLQARAWSATRSLHIGERARRLHFLYTPGAAPALEAVYEDGSTAPIALAGKPTPLSLAAGEAQHARWENPRPYSLVVSLRGLARDRAGRQTQEPRPPAGQAPAGVLAVTASLEVGEYAGAPALHDRFVKLYRRADGARARLGALSGRANGYVREAEEEPAVWAPFAAWWLQAQQPAVRRCESALAGLRRAEVRTEADLKRLEQAVAGAEAACTALDAGLSAAGGQAARRLLAGVRGLTRRQPLRDAAQRHRSLASSRSDRRALRFAYLSDTYAATSSRLLGPEREANHEGHEGSRRGPVAAPAGASPGGHRALRALRGSPLLGPHREANHEGHKGARRGPVAAPAGASPGGHRALRALRGSPDRLPTDRPGRWDQERALRYASYAAGYARRALQAASTSDTPSPRHPSPPEPKLPGTRASLCLNGTWECTGGGSESAPDDQWREVAVPHVPSMSGRFTWYRLRFAVPAGWAGSVLRLRFDGAGHACEVFLNGYYCGSHRGSRPRFSIPITDVARPGQQNTLLVLALDSTDSEVEVHKRTDTRFPWKHFPEWDIYGRFAGIWQDVFLEALPPVHAETGLLATSVRRREMVVPVTLTNADWRPRTVTVRPLVRDGRKVALDLGAQTVTLGAERSAVLTFRKPWKNPRLWGIGGQWGSPHLYFLDIETRERAKTLDHAYLRFGFRESWFAGHHFLLNGKRLRLQGYQTLYDPWHGPQMGNTEYMRRHMKLARRANFNTQRLFTSDSYLSYDIADEVGFLSEACWYGTPYTEHLTGAPDWQDPVGVAACRQFYRDWVQAYGNYASMVLWSPENEALAVGLAPGSPPERLTAHRHSLAYWRQVDVWVKGDDPMRRPVHHHGCNGILDSPDRKQLEIIGWHYPTPPDIERWGKEPKRKPCIIGEWCPGGQGFALDPEPAKSQLDGVVKAVRDSERMWRRYEIAGDMPHYLAARATWCAHPREWRGPWPEAQANVNLPATWPSLSGRGAKVPVVCVTPHYSYLINWFDPTRPEYTPNTLNDAFREGFDAMPPLPERIPPGLLVSLSAAGQPAAGAYILAIPAAGQNTAPVGVMADAKGTAWLWLQQAGRYRLKALLPDGRSTERLVNARLLPLDAPPGYDYLQHEELTLR